MKRRGCGGARSASPTACRGHPKGWRSPLARLTAYIAWSARCTSEASVSPRPARAKPMLARGLQRVGPSSTGAAKAIGVGGEAHRAATLPGHK